MNVAAQSRDHGSRDWPLAIQVGASAMSEIIESVKTAELTPSELDLVSGGVSLNFSKIEMSYVPQNADGTSSQESHK
jgi:type VI protein secretion system component Hcp